MTKHPHPITPPPELVDLVGSQAAAEIAKKILQWAAPILRQQGADQELEACCEWMEKTWWIEEDLSCELRAARRPKPPSLKEQALEQLDGIATCFRATHMGDIVCDKIRRALEALDD